MRAAPGNASNASERVLAGLAGADAHHLLDGGDEDLAVADLAGAGRALDGFDHAVHQVADRQFVRIPEVDRAIQEHNRRLNGSGRVVIRYSGTEPLLRIMVEAEQSSVVKEVADDLARVVREHIG